jgi:PAS domain-containing protein
MIVRRSELHITDDKLRESLRFEGRAQSFLDANPDLMFLIRRDGTYLDFRPAKGIPTYVEPHGFLGRQVRDVLPENVAEPSQYFIEQALVTRQPQCFDYELPLMGSPRSYEARIVPNGPDQVLVVVRDVTERSRADAAVREREAHFRAIFEHVSDAIGVAYWGNLVFVNPAHAKLFGYETPAELVGQSVIGRDFSAEARGWKAGPHPLQYERTSQGRLGIRDGSSRLGIPTGWQDLFGGHPPRDRPARTSEIRPPAIRF